MRSPKRAGRYAPFPLETDAAAFGLTATRVTTASTSIVARHPAVRSAATATLFLHGAAGSWTTWTPLLRAAAETGTDLGDTVLFDLPGFGEVADSPGSLESISEAVHVAAGRLGYDRVRLVGHSMGGLIALHLAATRPQWVESVGMVSGTGVSVIGAVRHPWRWFGRLPAFVSFRGVMIVLARFDRPARALVRFLGRVGLLRAFVTPLFRHTRLVDRSVIDALAVELFPRSFVRATDEVREYSPPAVSCPVRATMGDVDRFSTAADLEALGDADTTVVVDCGHFGTIERPFEVLAALFGTSAPTAILEP